MAQVIEDRKIPILSIGTVDRIRRGKISVRPCTDQISGADVGFADGTVEQFDVILQATGYRPNLRSLLPDQQDAKMLPTRLSFVEGQLRIQAYSFADIPVSTGQFREIAIEANGIARAIQTRSIRTGSPPLASHTGAQETLEWLIRDAPFSALVLRFGQRDVRPHRRSSSD